MTKIIKIKYHWYDPYSHEGFMRDTETGQLVFVNCEMEPESHLILSTAKQTDILFAEVVVTDDFHQLSRVARSRAELRD